MLKKRFDYGLMLIERLKESPDNYIDVRGIARENKIPSAYLEKIAQELKKAGWIESRRGNGGGYRIKEAYLKISVSELINFFERPYEICPIGRIVKFNAYDQKYKY